MKKIAASLFLAGLGSAAVAQTNAPATRALSLQDCLTEALQHNFDVRVERYEPEKSLLSLHAAYAGYDPVFSLSATHSQNEAGGFLHSSVTTNFVPTFVGTNFVPTQAVYTNNPGVSITRQNVLNSDLKGSLPWGMTYDFNGNVTDQTLADSAGGSVGVTLNQPLLQNFWIDDTRLSISAAKNQVKLSEQGLRAQLITTVTAVENAYYELIYARENVKVEQEALELAQTQLDQDKQRVQFQVLAEHGGAIEQDEAQVAQSRANLIAAQFTLVADENALKNLITDNYLQWHDVAIEPAATLAAVRQLFDVQDSWSKGLAQRPDLLQAKVNLEQQGIQLKYDRNQIFPQLNFTGSYGFNGDGKEFSDVFGQYNEGNRPFYSYGGSLSVPLSNAKARNSYKGDKAVEQQFLLKLKQLEQNIMVAIDNAVKQAQSAWESVDATQKSRLYAEAALKAEQGKYDAGKSTTFTVLQLQNNLTSARSQEIRALANYNEALANLAQQEGSTLERHRLDVRVK